MNLTHLHLAINHVPVLGTIFGLALLSFAIRRRSDELKKTALGVFVIAALFAVPVYFTGEPAEDGVDALPGVSESIIERHEEAASIAFTSVLVLGGAALTMLILLRGGKTVPALISFPMLAGALVVSGLMAWTANLGGQVRHTEIRPGAIPPAMENRTNHD